MNNLLITFIFFIGIRSVLAQDPAENPVYIHDIQEGRAQLIGLLGKRVGEKIVIEGILPNTMTMLENPIRVLTVDGKKLDKPINISLKESKKIEAGYLYTIVGYESGEFSLSPKWTWPEGEIQQSSFRFFSFFISVEVTGKKAL